MDYGFDKNFCFRWRTLNTLRRRVLHYTAVLYGNSSSFWGYGESNSAQMGTKYSRNWTSNFQSLLMMRPKHSPKYTRDVRERSQNIPEGSYACKKYHAWGDAPDCTFYPPPFIHSFSQGRTIETWFGGCTFATFFLPSTDFCASLWLTKSH